MGLKERLKAAAGKRKPLKVEVAGLDCELYVRVLSVGERDRWELSCVTSPSGKLPPDFRSKYLAMALCDEDGKRLWTDDEWQEVAELDGGIVGNLFEVAIKHNKMSEADLKELAGE